MKKKKRHSSVAKLSRYYFLGVIVFVFLQCVLFLLIQVHVKSAKNENAQQLASSKTKRVLLLQAASFCGYHVAQYYLKQQDVHLVGVHFFAKPKKLQMSHVRRNQLVLQHDMTLYSYDKEYDHDIIMSLDAKFEFSNIIDCSSKCKHALQHSNIKCMPVNRRCTFGEYDNHSLLAKSLFEYPPAVEKLLQVFQECPTLHSIEHTIAHEFSTEKKHFVDVTSRRLLSLVSKTLQLKWRKSEIKHVTLLTVKLHMESILIGYLQWIRDYYFPRYILMTTYFTQQIDPQYKIQRPRQNFELMRSWYQSVNRFPSIRAIIFHDELSNEYIRNYTSSVVQFQHAIVGNHSNNDGRFYIYYDYLKSVVRKAPLLRPDYVLSTDLFDVIINKNPFEYMRAHDTGTLYAGSELRTFDFGWNYDWIHSMFA